VTGTVSMDGGKYATLRCEITNAFYDIVHAMPGFKKWRSRDLLFEPTAANVEYLQAAMPDLKWDAGMKAVLARIAADRKQAEKVRTRKAAADIKPDGKFQFKTKPMKHQNKAFMLQRDAEYFALFMEQGTGKTKVIIDTVAYLYDKKKIDTLIILAPNGVHTNWILDEIPKHMPDWCTHVSAIYRSQLSRKEKETLLRVYQTRDKLRIVAVNIEAMSHKRQAEEMLALVKSCRAMVVVDESSRIRTPGAARTRNVVKLRKVAPYRRILTGTPVPKGAEGLYSQLSFLSEDILGFSSFWTFRARYCVMGGWEGRQIVGYRNLDDLQAKVDGCSYRVLKEDCLDLPPKVFSTRYVELTPEQRKIYNELEDEFITEFGGGVVNAALPITRVLRMQQVVGNWLPAGDGQPLRRISDNNPRLDALLEEGAAMHELGKRTIIWARFTHEINEIVETLRELYGVEAVVKYNGEVSNADREIAKTSFQDERSKVSFFVGQAASAGLGLTLTRASLMVYYSQDSDLEKRLQSEDRTHRMGLAHSLRILDLSATNTVDQNIVKAHQKRLDFAKMLLRDPVGAMRGQASEFLHQHIVGA